MPHILASEYENICPIWGTPAYIVPYERHIKEVSSPRVASVPYLIHAHASFVNKTFEYIANDDKNVHKAKLTTMIIDNHCTGKSYDVIINDNYVLQAREQTRLNFSQRLNRLLKYLIIESEENFVGYKLHMNPKSLMEELAHYTLYKRLSSEEYAKSVKRCYEASAWSESIEWPELSFLIKQLSERELLDIVDTYGGGLSCQVKGNAYMAKDEEVIRGDLFGDFLEIATRLMTQKNKNAAAVLTSVALEIHLKKLCAKNNIDIINDNGNPKKASKLNIELYEEDVYPQSDMQNITAWLSIRNDVLHGTFDKYTHKQVDILIAGVKEFIVRHPA